MRNPTLLTRRFQAHEASCADHVSRAAVREAESSANPPLGERALALLLCGYASHASISAAERCRAAMIAVPADRASSRRS